MPSWRQASRASNEQVLATEMNLAFALVAAFAAATVSSPGPQASPTEAPLREIGRVRATTPLCKTLAAHASAAVDQEQQGDRRVLLTVISFRTDEFDKSVITKNSSTTDLRHQFVALRAGAVAGLAEVKAFRDSLKEVTDPTQKADLEKFADALAGALNRQKKLAEELGRYIAWLDSQEWMSDQDRDDAQHWHMQNLTNPTGKDPVTGQPVRIFHNPFGDYNNQPETFNHAARRAGDEFELRAAPISGDEDDAAKRIEPAFKGC
jgi:hypothetical protein